MDEAAAAAAAVSAGGCSTNHQHQRSIAASVLPPDEAVLFWLKKPASPRCEIYLSVGFRMTGSALSLFTPPLTHVMFTVSAQEN